MNLKGKNVVITGAASGLGRQMAVDCASMGANLILLDLNENNLVSIKEQCSKNNKVETFACDVTDRQRMIEIAKFQTVGKVDIVIANAGLGGINPGHVLDPSIDEKIVKVNYFGMVNTFNAFLPDLLEKKNGHLAAVSSLASQRGLPFAASYSASKAAQNNFCESMRLDLKPYGIKVTTICPGFIKTPMTDHDAFDMPFMVPVEKASRVTLKAILNGKRMLMFPFPMKVLSLINRMLPNWLYDLILPLTQKKEKPTAAKIF